MEFTAYPVRVHLRTRAPLRLPALAANPIRGALGTLVRETACTPECRQGGGCADRGQCVFTRLFQPEGTSAAFATPPKPFVIRSRALDRASLGAGEPFSFDLHFFLEPDAYVPALTAALHLLPRSGFGDERVSVVFERLEILPVVRLSLAPYQFPIERAVVHFVTPLELKHSGIVLQTPLFGPLLRRIHERIGHLSRFYGDGSLDSPLPDPSRVELVRFEVQHRTLRRRSSRTGQTHPLGGIAGWAEYRGPLAEFAPYLEAAAWTGAGRQASWGKGELVVEHAGSGKCRELHLKAR